MPKYGSIFTDISDSKKQRLVEVEAKNLDVPFLCAGAAIVFISCLPAWVEVL